MRSLVLPYKRRILLKNGVRTEKFYVKFWSDECRAYTVRRSVDSLLDELGDKSRKEVRTLQHAKAIGERALQKGLINISKEKEVINNDPLFVDYISAFWDYDTSDYVIRKNKESAYGITRIYVEGELNSFNNHVRPFIPEGLRLSQITSQIIEKIKRSMQKAGKASSTINNMLQSVRIPLSEAFIIGDIDIDVASKIKNVPTRIKKPRGVPTTEEVNKLLAFLSKTTSVGCYDRLKYLFIYLGAFTGLREGELRALKLSDLSIIDPTTVKITVQHGYNKVDKLKCTKGKEERTASIPIYIYDELLQVSKLNSIEGGYLFFSLKKETVPIGYNLISKWLRNAYEAIGIDKETQELRNLTFHSFRHYFASASNGKVDDEERRIALGHKSMRMTDYYTHLTDEQLIGLKNKMEKIFLL